MNASESIALAHAAGSIVLSYPDEKLKKLLPSLRAATKELPASFANPFDRTLSYLEAAELPELAAHYVDTFDLRRRCCLHLTYYTHGDTRRRGVALLRFKQVYREVGLQVAESELPDHLAVVLEFSATGYPAAAIELLVKHRVGLDMLCGALHRLDSPYAHAVDAVRATLPPASRTDLLAAQRLATDGPPSEQVGVS
jgi:nitrate reductase molybdenum cofactor assembly chaperone NarJ/NarW